MKNHVIIAAAGAGKTRRIIDKALENPERRALILTYTNANVAQITNRIYRRAGGIPSNVTVLSWYRFLLRELVRPYQSAYARVNYTRSINFGGTPPRAKGGRNNCRYFYDRNRDVYRDRTAELARHLNALTGSAPIARLQDIYDIILIDELQDLVGYDLDILELLFGSTINVMVVGDPRQVTYSTHRPGNRYKKYRGKGIGDWVEKLAGSGLVHSEYMNTSRRCCPEICHFMSQVYPEYPPITSKSAEQVQHAGIVAIRNEYVPPYMERYKPVPLRYNVNSKVTHGIDATNIGLVKGETYDRVLVFPTKGMLRFLCGGSPKEAGSCSHLYVAVTRARYSAAFVIKPNDPEPTRAKVWTPADG